MEHYGLAPQSVITHELLVGTDGVDKMSKSQNNYVGIDEAPEEQFGKGDVDSGLSPRPVVAAHARRAAPGRSDGAKLALARIVDLYHGARAARRAEAHFTRVVRRGARAGGRRRAAVACGRPCAPSALLAMRSACRPARADA